MSAVPVIPGIPNVSGSIGPGLTASFDITMNACNARPVMVYVTRQQAGSGNNAPWPPTEQGPPGVTLPPPPPAPIPRPPAPGGSVGGQIWRLIDPLSPLEKLPVMKEWTEEISYRNGHWRPVTVTPPPVDPVDPVDPGPRPPTEIVTDVFRFDQDVFFHFDKPTPSGNDSLSQMQAFRDPIAAADALDRVKASVNTTVPGPNGSVPLSQGGVEKRVVMFGHADMCASFGYNFSLSHRRNLAIMRFIDPTVRAAVHTGAGACQGLVSCADFNPDAGPNEHERAAENSATGFATKPAGASETGNLTNRRVELFVIPDYTRASGKPSEIAAAMRRVRTRVLGELDAATRLTVETAWRDDGTFPCPQGVTSSSPGTEGLLTMCHRLVNPPEPHQGSGEGPAFRRCRFYAAFQDEMRGVRVTAEVPGQPTEPVDPNPPVQPPTEFVRWEWVEDEPVTETIGEYHPPRGEHYSYFMDEMVKAGVPASELFAAQIPVAPNNQVNPDDFNLIRPGTIRVVKMDLGFWGDQRTPDLARQAGFRRTPSRYFGLIEGQFVFLCYFETPENAGHVRWCSDGFDQQMTPLCFALDQAVQQANPNFHIRIIATTVAEAGPDPSRLKVMFGDMHLPRRFEVADPTYAQDECTRRLQMLKSAIVHQLKQDYRLPAASTPWLCSIDRELCKAFFENGAPTLKLPHYYTLNGPTFSNPLEPEGDGFIDQAMDVMKKAKQLIYQAGNRLFEFTQADYRRMTRKYPDNFPEKGYGRTKDVLANLFYGSTTDVNTPAPQEGNLERMGKAHIPQIVQEGLDEHAGTNLQKNPGTAPATESYAVIDAGPARDLLRLLNVIQTTRRGGTNIDVIQTGDLMELGMNRRFLFEDFHQTDDPAAQIPKAMAELAAPTPKDNAFSDIGLGGVAAAAGDLIKKLIVGQIKGILGGMNAEEQDLWFRRESNKAAADPAQDADLMMLRPEESWNLDGVRNDFQLPDFVAPSAGPGTVSLATDPNRPLRTPTVDLTRTRFGVPQPDGTLGPINASPYRGRGYLSTEAQNRINQVLAFTAPIRTDANGSAEDRQLLGGALSGTDGQWNRAIVQAFQRANAIMVYGDADLYRGLPRVGGRTDARPFYSEDGLWVEHGHRFEDSMLDGQPLSSFLKNLQYEIQELPFGASLLDEYFMHREQSFFQPGLIQWFLLVQFGGPTFLQTFQRPNENVPSVNPFRICVNGHTHQPDLCIAQIIFKDREVAEVKLPFDVPLLGDSISMETIVNGGGALLKGIMFMQKIEQWITQFDNRQGFEKIWADMGGNGIDWFGDFAGLAKCADRALAFIRQQGQNVGNRLQNEWDRSTGSLRNAANDNLAANRLGRPL
ncbi:MAG: hypothetical protein ACKVS9_15970 [Phycisphaerae bacterium]